MSGYVGSGYVGSTPNLHEETVPTPAPPRPPLPGFGTSTFPNQRQYAEIWTPPRLWPEAWINKPTYIPPTHNRDTFQVGDVIRRPSHKPNLNARLHGSAHCLATTDLRRHFKINGKNLDLFVFSKDRMYVIMHKTEHSMYALPLYSHNGRGMAALSERRKHEFVSVRDRFIRNGFFAQGPHPAIDFVHQSNNPRHALDANTTIDMAGGETITWQEEALWPVGRLTKKGWERLINLHDDVIKKAREESVQWPADDGWESPASKANKWTTPRHPPSSPTPPPGGRGRGFGRGGGGFGRGGYRGGPRHNWGQRA